MSKFNSSFSDIEQLATEHLNPSLIEKFCRTEAEDGSPTQSAEQGRANLETKRS